MDYVSLENAGAALEAHRKVVTAMVCKDSNNEIESLHAVCELYVTKSLSNVSCTTHADTESSRVISTKCCNPSEYVTQTESIVNTGAYVIHVRLKGDMPSSCV